MSQGIAYQNKDIASKYFADHFGIKSLNVYGLNLPDIKQVLPTNLLAIQADELRLDNLFLLMDGTLALVDYESVYKLISKIKYSNYGIRIVERYIKEGRPAPVIRLIVIYTADVEPKDVETELDCGFMKLTITPAFLSKVDGDGVLQSITSKIQSGQRLTDEELLQLMILPLSYKTKEKKQEKIKEAVQLTMNISDEDVKNFTLSGLLVFTDKVIDDDTETYVRRMIAMTKIGRMFEQEKIEAVAAEKREIAKKLITLGEDSHEKIALVTGLPLETIKELAGEKAS